MTLLERAYGLARQLNVSQTPHPHQAAAAIGAEEPRREKPKDSWVHKVLPMVVIAELEDARRALKINLRGDILGIAARLGTRVGTFYGVQARRNGDAVHDNRDEARKKHPRNLPRPVSSIR